MLIKRVKSSVEHSAASHRKIQFPLDNAKRRGEIMQIHAMQHTWSRD